MCQTCIGCGKCEGEVRPPLPAGLCPMCGTENEDGAAVCEGCGAPLPKPPGPVKDRSGAGEKPAQGRSGRDAEKPR